MYTLIVDEKKFFRILYYLHGTRSLGITLKFTSSQPTINVYVDVAYGINPDRKSRTGLCRRTQPTCLRRSRRRQRRGEIC
jgi:hypothetical protein